MSREYSTAKIKEALKTAKGNTQIAHKLIVAQAMQDPKLLTELVKPHMTGIVAHAVNHVASDKTKPEAVKKPASKKSKKDNFGLDLLKSIADGDSAQFGQEAYARPVAKKSALQKHIDAIQQMIEKTSGDDS